MVFYVFGYGSLIFRPPPHTISRTEGYVKPYVRRFCQSSNDHRGTPERPGRVVTLVRAADWAKATGSSSSSAAVAAADGGGGQAEASDDDRVWGVALEIDPAYEQAVRAELDEREKNGYTTETIDLYRLDAAGREEVALPAVTVYIGRPDNEAFVGAEPLDRLARRIHSCRGPSGENRAYLFDLAKAVHELEGGRDDYLFELEAAVRRLDDAEGRTLHPTPKEGLAAESGPAAGAPLTAPVSA